MLSSNLSRLAKLEDSRPANTIYCHSVFENGMWTLKGNNNASLNGVYTPEEKTAIGQRADVNMVSVTVRSKVD